MKKVILYSVFIILGIGIAGYFVPTPLQITKVQTNTNHTVSAGELTQAKILFQKNHIDMGTLAVNSVIVDEGGGSHIRANQFYNGLPIFLGGDIIYHFDASGRPLMDGTNQDGTDRIYISGERISNLGISTEPRISASTAARKAREKIKLNYFFTAELGFWDLTAGMSHVESNFVLVWKIKPNWAREVPYAIIDANSGKLIRYDDGIVN